MSRAVFLRAFARHDPLIAGVHFAWDGEQPATDGQADVTAGVRTGRSTRRRVPSSSFCDAFCHAPPAARLFQLEFESVSAIRRRGCLELPTPMLRTAIDAPVARAKVARRPSSCAVSSFCTLARAGQFSRYPLRNAVARMLLPPALPMHEVSKAPAYPSIHYPPCSSHSSMGRPLETRREHEWPPYVWTDACHCHCDSLLHVMLSILSRQRLLR